VFKGIKVFELCLSSPRASRNFFDSRSYDSVLDVAFLQHQGPILSPCRHP